MAKIYLSSTYGDLKEYREAVYDALRKIRHDVVAMEDYVATDERPLDKCLNDVAECELYVGVFAWRYGYVPDKDNPEQKSITELEYRRVCELKKPRLIFMLAEDAPWSRHWMDEVTGEGEKGERIKTLRAEWGRDKTVSFFKTPEELAGLAGAGVHNWEAEAGRREREREEIGLEAALELLAKMPLDDIPDPAPSLPRGSRMPLSVTPLFVGREEDVKKLARALKVGSPSIVTPDPRSTPYPTFTPQPVEAVYLEVVDAWIKRDDSL